MRKDNILKDQKRHEIIIINNSKIKILRFN